MQVIEDVEQGADPIAWNDLHLLGYGPMDDLHEEFVQLVGKLQQAQHHEIEPLLDTLHEHMSRHFQEEEDWMERTVFPPRDCHRDEHAEVMAALTKVRAQADMGIYAFCRPFADYLAEWFPRHATHLDSALAHWMCKRSLGGKPVVIRRNILSQDASA